MFEVPGQRTVPPKGVVAGLEMLELGSPVDFYSLRKSRRAQQEGERHCEHDLFLH
jgi:hypothetical protein